MSDNLKKGDIIRFTSLPLHYAVYIGDGYIVHYNKRDDEKLSIMKEPLEEYIKRSKKLKHVKVTYVSLLDSKKSPEKIKERALQALRGQAKYNLVFTNCEQFVTWCVYGKKVSGNVRAAAIGGAAAAGALAGGGTGVVLGGVIGTEIFPGVGTVAGGIIGGGIGAVVGAVAGATTSGATVGVVHLATEETEHFN